MYETYETLLICQKLGQATYKYDHIESSVQPDAYI